MDDIHENVKNLRLLDYLTLWFGFILWTELHWALSLSLSMENIIWKYQNKICLACVLGMNG